jgi:hypothetical protein
VLFLLHDAHHAPRKHSCCAHHTPCRAPGRGHVSGTGNWLSRGVGAAGHTEICRGGAGWAGRCAGVFLAAPGRGCSAALAWTGAAAFGTHGLCAGQHGLEPHLPGGGGGSALGHSGAAAVAGIEHADARKPSHSADGHPRGGGSGKPVGGTAILVCTGLVSAGGATRIHFCQPQFLCGICRERIAVLSSFGWPKARPHAGCPCARSRWRWYCWPC